MKNIIKQTPDTGSKNYNVVNKDKDNVYVHKKSIGINPSLSVAGDIAFYNKDDDKVIIVSQSDWNITDFPADKFEPIGVVVVPGTHNVYGDGSCGVMSLKGMDCTNSNAGSSIIGTMWSGVYSTDILTLPNLNKTPIVGSGSNVGDVNSTVTGQVGYAHLPSDAFSAVQCPHDTDAYYYTSNSSYDQAPSPYLTDGGRNPAYYQITSPSSSNNCLADFGGRGNTDKIIAQRGNKDYSSWKPDCNTGDDYPAASCCDMFYTEGTQQGDWYLPAMGELGYIMPPFRKINNAITKMRNEYGSSVGFALNTSSKYWASSEYSAYSTRIISTGDGFVDYYNKNTPNYVRAFLRVNAHGVVRN